jgi:hypothetical protein
MEYLAETDQLDNDINLVDKDLFYHEDAHRAYWLTPNGDSSMENTIRREFENEEGFVLDTHPSGVLAFRLKTLGDIVYWFLPDTDSGKEAFLKMRQ